MNALSRMEREAFEKGKRYGIKSSIENAAAAVAKRTFLQVLSDNQEQLNIKRTNKLQEKGRVRGYYGVQVVDQYPNGGRILIKDRG